MFSFFLVQFLKTGPKLNNNWDPVSPSEAESPRTSRCNTLVLTFRGGCQSCWRNSAHWLLCACGRSVWGHGGPRSVRGAPAAEGHGAALRRSRGPAEGPLMPMSTEADAEPTSLKRSNPFVSFRTRQVSDRFWYGVITLRMRKIPNPASTKALQARVCYPSIAFSILRIDNQRQPSPFYTFLVLVYANYYMEIPYSMSWCKTRKSELLKGDDWSIYRDADALLWSPVLELCSCLFSIVLFLLIWRRKRP